MVTMLIDNEVNPLFEDKGLLQNLCRKTVNKEHSHFYCQDCRLSW